MDNLASIVAQRVSRLSLVDVGKVGPQGSQFGLCWSGHDACHKSP